MRTAAQRTLDAVCVLTLTGFALWGLDAMFSGREYLAVGMVGAATAVLIALAVASQGARTDLFLLWAAAAYLPVACITTSPSLRRGQLPVPSDVLDVLTATLTAPGELLTTIPPLDPEGTILVVPFAVGYLAAGASAWIAMRTRRPLAPVVPLLVAQAIVILLGPFRPDTTTLVSATAFAALGFWWAGQRGAARVPGIDGSAVSAGRGRATRAVAGIVMVAAAAAAVATWVPPSTLVEDRSVLRGRVGNGATIDEFDNPLVTFRRFTPQADGSPDNVFDKTLLVLSGLDEPVPLRFVILDAYDGTAWRADNRTVDDVEDDLFQRIGSEVAAPRPGSPLAVGVEVKNAYTGAWLPLAGQLTSIEFDFADGRAQREDVRYNPATSSAMVVGGLAGGDDYTFTALLPETKPPDSARAYPVEGRLQSAGAPLDKYLKPWVRTGRPPMEQVLLLAHYLHKNGRYSDGVDDPTVPPGHDVKLLTKEFFGAERIVGNDEQYAAFMALAANRLGVPARVVVGAYAGDGKVRGKDVQAWVELRVGDGSWRMLPTSRFMTHRPPGEKDRPPQSPDDFVRDELPERDGEGSSSDQGQQQDGGGQSTDSSQQEASAAALPRWVLLVGLLSWSVPAMKLARRVRRRHLGRPSARMAAAWLELLDLAADLGRPVPVGLTKVEQATLLGVAPGLAHDADTRIFAAEPPTAEQANDLWAEVDQARRRMVRSAGPVGHFRQLFAPASLLRSVRRRRRHVWPRPLRAVRQRLARGPRRLRAA